MDAIGVVVSLLALLVTTAAALIVYVQREPEPTFVVLIGYLALSLLPLSAMFMICRLKAGAAFAYNFATRLMCWRLGVLGSLVVVFMGTTYSLRQLPGQEATRVGAEVYSWKFDSSSGHRVYFEQEFMPKTFRRSGSWRAWLDARTARHWYIEDVVAYLDPDHIVRVNRKDYDFAALPNEPNPPRDYRSGRIRQFNPGLYYFEVKLHATGRKPQRVTENTFFMEDVHLEIQPDE